MTEARVGSLYVYPVKGCGGIAPTSAMVAITGLTTEGVGDREWMVVDLDSRFVTQREFPRLALLRTHAHDGTLTLTAPDMAPLVMSTSRVSESARDVVVWHSEVRGFDAGDEAAAWLSAGLRAEVRLVRFDRSLARACNKDYVGESGAHTLFADGYPALVIGDGSLAELNERLAARGHPALPMNRFRPNVVLQDLPPFAEDHIETITIGDVVLKLVKPCTRCQVPTTDQESAEVGIEPTRTLGEFRMNEQLGGVTFGMNAIVAAGAGHTIDVGAPVTIEYRF